MFDGKMIYYIDMLYSPRASFDQDYLDWKSALEGLETKHFKFAPSTSISNILTVLRLLKDAESTRVVIASAKSWQIFLLAIFGGKHKLYHIIHFLPNRFRQIHLVCLKIGGSRFKYGTLEVGVKDLLFDNGVTSELVGVRYYDKALSLERILGVNDKLKDGDSVNVLIPGVKEGVRRMPTPTEFHALERILGAKLVLQYKGEFDLSEVPEDVELKRDVDSDEYNRLFEEADIVVMHFDNNYETRSSAMIYDALRNGCIVWTSSHPIVTQLGYPNFVLRTFGSIDEKIGNFVTGDLPGFDKNQLKDTWIKFLD